MTPSNAILLAGALISGAILIDHLIPPATAQVETFQGGGAKSAVAGERLWWVESRARVNRVHMCIDEGTRVTCLLEDVAK